MKNTNKEMLMYVSVMGTMVQKLLEKNDCQDFLAKDDPRRTIVKVLTDIHKQKKFHRLMTQHIQKDLVKSI